MRETNEKLTMFDTLSKAGKYLGQAAKMMIGVPDYDNYVEHMRVNHPDQTPMTPFDNPFIDVIVKGQCRS